MFVTIWMCTHEWSLISIRATAFTFATCHQPFSWSSRLTRSITVRSVRFARTGTRMRISPTACFGVMRVSRSASGETGWSIRSFVSGSTDNSGAHDDRRSGLVVQALLLLVPERPQDVDEPDDRQRADHSADDVPAQCLPVARTPAVFVADADADRALADRLA